MSEDQRRARSVNDYESEDDLRKALMAVEPSGDDSLNATDADQNFESDEDTVKTCNLDWVLPSSDPETTEVQSMKEELKRLQILKSYLILDAEREQAFERITALASRIFDVPIALVSLVDLGRQWFMSNHGLGEVRETPRKLAFCAHAILSKTNALVVPDATKDFRFKDSPLVTGPPNIRFYAGAPLESPEGYKLGTFCIIDDKIRPEGLSDEQLATLRDLADMVVKVMVDRRYKLENQEDPARLIAYTAHDLMTPLTGVQLSLSLLKDDEKVRNSLDSHQLDLLNTAATSSDLMIRICMTALEGLRKESPSRRESSNTRSTCTKLEDLVKSLQMIMDPIPKQTPLIITLDPAVPREIASDDLKLFRSALNLLSNAAERTTRGFVRLQIYVEDGSLVFKCEDTGSSIDVQEEQYLFKPSATGDGNLRLALSSVASQIYSMDGECGYRPRCVSTEGSIVRDAKGRRLPGSIFWFSIPIGDSTMDSNGMPRRMNRNGAAKDPIIPSIHRTSSNNSIIRRSGSNSSVSTSGKRRLPLMVGDFFQADAVNESCLNAVFEPSVQSDSGSEGFVDSKMPAIPTLVRLQPDSSQSYADDCKPPARPSQSSVPTSVSSSSIAMPPRVRTRRALVIEDSIVILKSISRALGNMGFEVTQAVNGMEGLKALKKTMFDITLCDFLMPVMDGLDCVKQYRAWEEKNRSSFRQWIVGISAHASVINNSNQGIEAGMDDFRAKPISIKTLTELQECDAVFARSRILDELCEGVKPAIVHGVPAEVQSSAKRRTEEIKHPAHIAKRKRSSEPAPVCLIATDTPTKKSSSVLTALEKNGWKVAIVNDGSEALKLLQMRNWDAVLIDDDLPPAAAAPCVAAFRKWEEQNRVNGQRNIFLVCDADVPSPSDSGSVVQAPSGFDGVLRKPVSWNDFQSIVKKNCKDGALDIVVRRN